jgi:hypothetical protein
MVDRTKLGRRCSRRPSYTRTRGGAECGSPPETTAANISCPQIISGSRSRRLSSDAVAQKCRGGLLPTTRRVCGIGPTFWYAQPGDAMGIPSRRRVASRLTRSRLEVAPNQPSFPLGMPIRVGLVLRNLTNVVIPTPASLSLKSAFVRGRVIDAAGVARTFLPFLVSTLGVPPTDVDPATPHQGALTC